jgi:small nuclear ribonucleoprotein (snRNP)-like protein
MAIGKRVALVFTLITTMVFSPLVAIAQGSSSTSDWSSLRSIPVDSKLSVKLKTGKTIDGKLRSVSDATLTLISKNTSVELKQEEISTVHHLLKKSATTATLIGLGVGAGAGAAIGGLASSNDNSGLEKIDHVATAGLAVAGAVIGAVSGYFIGRGATKRVLVFENK